MAGSRAAVFDICGLGMSHTDSCVGLDAKVEAWKVLCCVALHEATCGWLDRVRV